MSNEARRLATELKIKHLMELPHRELAEFAMAAIDTTYFTTVRCMGLFRTIGVDKEIVQAMLDMKDDMFNDMWDDAPDVALVAVKIKHSDN